MSEPIVGIDLGTTNSLVAVVGPGGPRVIPDEEGRPLLPSVVRFEGLTPAGRPGVAEVGAGAKASAAEFPATTVASVKRLMGRSRRDAASDLPFLSYEVAEGEHGQARVSLPVGPGDAPVLITPQEVSAVILRRLRERAERALGVPVTKAVVTVPAYFDHAQREATRDAGRLAGLDVVRVVPEPTAAALAYGLGVREHAGASMTSTEVKRRARAVAVFDLGGGTFDVSILRLVPPAPGPGGAAGREIFQVVATSGDTRLGGDDVDHLLMGLFEREILAARMQPMELRPGLRRRLGDEAERVKIELSDRESARVVVPVDDSLVYEREVTRAELEALIEPWVARAMECCRRAALDARAGLGEEPIDAVVMVGGSTRIPLVRRRVAAFFGLEPYTAVDPDQVVALGAAVQASILSGVESSALLLDVIPLSLGLETAGGAVAKLVMRNSTVPARATEMFSTQVDGQTAIKLHVVQGEREMVADCRSLGTFHLRGLPPMPAGIPQVEVEFLVDANGVLSVSAHERRSGRRAAMQVVPSHGLTREEVARMESDALANAREDMTRHRIADLVVNSRLDLKWIGDGLARHGASLDPAYAARLEGLLETLRGMVAAAEKDWRSVDADAFNAAKTALDQASVRLQEVSITQSLQKGS